MRHSFLAFLLVVVCFLAGCGRDSRLHGKWTFDREYTEAQLQTKQAEGKTKTESLEGMKQQLVSMLVPQLIAKLDGSTLTIKPKEMILVTKDGTGTSEPYEIIERPAKDTWRTKKSNGDVETYTREGERLYSPASGDLHFNAYFKAAK